MTTNRTVATGKHIVKNAIETAIGNYYSSLSVVDSDELAAWGEFAMSEFRGLEQG